MQCLKREYLDTGDIPKWIHFLISTGILLSTIMGYNLYFLRNKCIYELKQNENWRQNLQELRRRSGVEMKT
jgi:hypothetical protein